jgi:hypothetical protein
MRTTFGLATVVVAGVLAGMPTHGAAPRFYRDDPVVKTPDTQDAGNVSPFEVDVDFDRMQNMFTDAGDPASNVRALDLNTVDEVPDSSWYTNRTGPLTLTPAAVARGPNMTDGPATGTWTVISAKDTGVMPGLVVRDRTGIDWFVKFDPVGHSGMASGAEVVSTRLLWALGFNVPENHVGYVRAEDLALTPGATIRTDNHKRSMRRKDIGQVLARAARSENGTYRVLASRRLEGKPVGPFRFHGVRPDDPNDYIPHEHRRVLRGYGLWAAWLNHVDSKSTNTLDVLVRKDGLTSVRHYLLDFGSTLGSAGVRPREPFEGSEYLYEGGSAWRSALGFGFPIKPWRFGRLVVSSEVGALPDSTSWDPERWKPRYPNPAFTRTRTDDRFWAARKLQSLTPDLIAAAVGAARYENPASNEAVIRFLLDRRAAILRRSLVAVNPVENPRLEATGTLTFDNAAVNADVAHIPRGYRTVWAWFDNATGETTPIGERTSVATEVTAPQRLAPMPDAYVKVEISAIGGADPSWAVPVHAYFRGTGYAWRLVGFERTPAGNPATPLDAALSTAPRAVAARTPFAAADPTGR